MWPPCPLLPPLPLPASPRGSAPAEASQLGWPQVGGWELLHVSGALRGRTQVLDSHPTPEGNSGHPHRYRAPRPEGACLTLRFPRTHSPQLRGALLANTEPTDLPAGGYNPGSLCPQPPPSSPKQQGRLHLPPPPTPPQPFPHSRRVDRTVYAWDTVHLALAKSFLVTCPPENITLSLLPWASLGNEGPLLC